MIELEAELMHPDPNPINNRHVMHTIKKRAWSKSTAIPNIGRESPRHAHPIIKVDFFPLSLRKKVIPEPEIIYESA